jgi:RNA polymerase sigma factor (sigma-70 family)
VSLAPHELAQPRSDGATPAAAQDPSAFGRLYKEHFEGLYDFVVRIVRDPDLAGEIVQSTFTKAWDELRAGHELAYPKAWLYTVARNQALDEVRRQQRLTGDDAVYAQPDPSRLADPQAVAEDNELVELVWASAAALKPDEYSLLDLHVRHGFDAPQIADALNLERGAVYTRLSRLRSSLEDSVASTLLVRRGTTECAELAAIVGEHGGGEALTPELRSAVRIHVKNCEICSEARRRAVAPVAIFGALAPVLPVAGLQPGILAAILPGGAAHAAAGASVAGGAAAAKTARHGTKAKYVAGAGGLAAAGLIAALALTSGSTVSDPSRASSIDHTVGVASADRTVAMRWAPGKNAKGYSVMFSRTRSAEPPARENVSGTRYTSGPLGPGRWWFILRSHGRDGGWTDTLRVGPFVITDGIARAMPHAATASSRTAKHHPAASAKHTASSSAATKPASSGVVAGMHTALGPSTTTAPGETTAPRETARKKKRTKTSPPHRGSPPPSGTRPRTPPASTTPPPSSAPPPAATPPATAAPPSGTSPTATPPAGGSPPATTTPPPPAEQGGGGEGGGHDHGDDDDDHGHDHDHGGDRGGDEGGGARGHDD